MTTSLAQRLRDRAASQPSDTWITTRREVRTWQEMWHETCRVATGLRDLGTGPGDTVSIFCRNGVEFIQFWLGAQSVGATVVPVNTGFQAAEAKYVLTHAGAHVILADELTIPVIRQILPSLANVRSVIVLDDADTAAEIAFKDFIDVAPLDDELVHQPTSDEIASILYTSGTTGPPKGCMLGHDYFTFGATSVIDQLQLTESDVMMCVLPLFHMNAQTSSVATSLHAGVPLVLEDRFSARGFWSRVKELGVTEFSYLGVISAALAKLPPTPEDRDHHLRVGFGAGMPAGLHAEFEERFGVQMLEVFGMTETCIDLATQLVKDRHVGRRSLGTVVPGKEVRIVDVAGSEVPDGEVGHLQVRGRGMFLGYLNDQEATEAAFDGPWFRTGDLARREADGWFYYVDRSKDIVRRAGENIGSVEVEAVLTSHPAVSAAAVIGVEDDVVGQEVKALLLVQEGKSASDELYEDILRHCADNLAAFKVPRFLQVLPDFPRTESQKIQKAKLRADFASAAESYERTWRPASPSAAP